MDLACNPADSCQPPCKHAFGWLRRAIAVTTLALLVLLATHKALRRDVAATFIVVPSIEPEASVDLFLDVVLVLVLIEQPVSSQTSSSNEQSGHSQVEDGADVPAIVLVEHGWTREVGVATRVVCEAWDGAKD